MVHDPRQYRLFGTGATIFNPLFMDPQSSERSFFTTKLTLDLHLCLVQRGQPLFGRVSVLPSSLSTTSLTSFDSERPHMSYLHFPGPFSTQIPPYTVDPTLPVSQSLDWPKITRTYLGSSVSCRSQLVSGFLLHPLLPPFTHSWPVYHLRPLPVVPWTPIVEEVVKTSSGVLDSHWFCVSCLTSEGSTYLDQLDEKLTETLWWIVKNRSQRSEYLVLLLCMEVLNRLPIYSDFRRPWITPWIISIRLKVNWTNT